MGYRSALGFVKCTACEYRYAAQESGFDLRNWFPFLLLLESKLEQSGCSIRCGISYLPVILYIYANSYS